MVQQAGADKGLEREFDVVLFGATGFTGKLVAEYLYQTYGTNGTLKWAMAGRSQQKLEAMAAGLADTKVSPVPLIVVDSSDEDAVTQLARRTRVICTTVGPYALYGTPVVAACAANGTHYCDLTGEVQWMYQVIHEYQTSAENSGARIVHTCGFDSIPSDLGVFFVQQQMFARHGVYAGQVRFRVAKADGGMSGGTVASLMNMMEEVKADPAIGDIIDDPYALNPRNMPQGPDGPDQVAAMYDTKFRQWTAPFVMAAINTRVVRRSNALLGFRYGQQFRYDEAILTGAGPFGYLKAAAVASGSFLVMLASAISPLRSMLTSVLPAQGEGPSEDTIKRGSFVIELLAEHPTDASKNLRGRITADRDPGYGATAKMLGESAVSLAFDPIDVGGGFWTPSTALGQTLINRLQASAGMTFDIID
jgi:short subunit dehydrogenase-like uncharacterized protein